MDITINSLLKHVPDDSHYSCSFPSRQILCMKKLHFLENESEENTLYAGDYSNELDLQSCQNLNLLLYVDDPSFRPTLVGSSNIIIVYSLDVYNSLINRILDIMKNNGRLTLISNEFLNILQNGGSLQKVLDYGYSLLGNPLLLIDVSFIYEASSGMGNIQDQPVWQYTLDNGIMPSDYIAKIMEDEVTYINSDNPSTQIITVAPMENNPHRSFSLRIIHNTAVLGYLKLLEKNHPFSDFDQEVFLLLAKYVSILSGNTMHNHMFGSKLDENFLSAILHKKLIDPKEIEAKQELFSVKLYEHLHVITIQFRTKPESEDAVYFALKKIKTFFATNIVTAINNSFVVLYDSKAPDQNEHMQRKFSALLDELSCHASISLAFQSLTDIYKHYEQTLFCIELRKLLKFDSPYIVYSDIYEYHMILKLSEIVDVKLLIHPAIKKLLEIDRQSNSNLVQTLFSFVRNHYNIATTSKALYLHYNTLKHRINRITELTGFDPEEGDETFRILLSEKILDFINKQK